MLISFLVGLVIFIGAFCGYALRKIAPEELAVTIAPVRVFSLLLSLCIAGVLLFPYISILSWESALFTLVGGLIGYFVRSPFFYSGFAFVLTTLLLPSFALFGACLLFLFFLTLGLLRWPSLTPRVWIFGLPFFLPFFLFSLPYLSTSPFLPALSYFISGALVMSQ